jgi:hypothetical protein
MGTRMPRISIADDTLSGCFFIAVQAPFVDEVWDEAADIGAHPARCGQKNSAIDRNGIVTGQEILERRLAALSGMRTLDRLRELHRITDQHDIFAQVAIATAFAIETCPAWSTNR